MKNIFIAGGEGIIGSNLTLKLMTKNYEINILGNLSTQFHGADPERSPPLYNAIKDKIKFVHGRVSNSKEWKKVLKGQDVIVLCTAKLA